MVKVEGHCLDEGFNTAHCSIEVSESAIEADLLAPAQPYADWAPLSPVWPEAERQRALLALMDGLRELLQLWRGGEAAAREQLLADVGDFLGLEARAFALEDRREAHELKLLIGEAELYEQAEWNRLCAKASADAHQDGRRALEARLWLDELKALPLIAMEARKIDAEGLKALRANLRAFPKALFEHYEADFALFSCNLVYHQIPRDLWRLAQGQGWVDERLRPLLNSDNQAAVLADVMADALALSPRWAPFERLWGIKDLVHKHSQAKLYAYYDTLRDKMKFELN